MSFHRTTEKKASLYIRQVEIEKAAKVTAVENSVQQHVAKIESRGSPRAQASEAASSSKDIPKVFPGKLSFRHQSGCLMYPALHQAACLRLRLHKLKPQKQRPKHQRHHLQERNPKGKITKTYNSKSRFSKACSSKSKSRFTKGSCKSYY